LSKRQHIEISTHLEVFIAEFLTEDGVLTEDGALTEDGDVVGVSARDQVHSIIFQNGMSEKGVLLVPPVAEPARVGRVVAVLAWVGAWPLSTVDPGMSPLFTELQTNPPSVVTRH
jgi:hypothetical protein